MGLQYKIKTQTCSSIHCQRTMIKLALLLFVPFSLGGPTHNVTDRHIVVSGDIAYYVDDDGNQIDMYNAINYDYNKWPYGIVYYQFSPGYSTNEKEVRISITPNDNYNDDIHFLKVLNDTSLLTTKLVFEK